MVDTFPVAVAQRYSIIVEARNETNTNYVLHADMDPQMVRIRTLVHSPTSCLSVLALLVRRCPRRPEAQSALDNLLHLKSFQLLIFISSFTDMSATISYGSGNARQEGSTRTDAELMAFDDLNMVPLEAIRMATADQDIPLSFAFDTFDNGNNRASFNDV